MTLTRPMSPLAVICSGYRQTWPIMVGLLTLIMIGCGLAYQIPTSVHLAVGGDPTSHRREDDAPFLQMVHAAEPAAPTTVEWWTLPGADNPYRWTQPESVISVPGLGGGHWLITVRAQGGRPDGAPTATHWQAGTWPPLELMLPATTPRRYTVLVPSDGAVHLTLRSEPLRVATDPRVLGFVLYAVHVQPVNGWRPPDWGQLGWLGLWLVAILVWGGTVGLPARWSMTGLAIGGGAAIVALGLVRPAFALLMPILTTLTLLATFISAIITLRRPHQLAWQQAISLTLIAVIVRLAGLLHPHAISSDAGFHANNLLRLGVGHVLLTAGLPAEVGGGLAPYPAGFYLIALPFQLLLNDDFASRRLLVTVIAAVLDSLFCLLIWWLVRQAGFGQRTALLSASGYIVATQALEALAIGELANVGGQALLIPALLGLSTGAAAPSSDRRALVGLTLAIAAGLMAHSGLTLSFGTFIGWAWLLAWRQPSNIVSPWRLFVAAAGGLALALMIMYTAPPYLELVVNRSSQGVNGGQPLLQIITDTTGALLGLQPPQRRSLPIPVGLALANLVGCWLLWRTTTPTASGLRWLLSAWWGSTLSSLALLLIADQGIRWALFLYPALCITAGIALDRIAEQGRLGKVVVMAWLVAIWGQGLTLWIEQIRDYLH